MVANLIGLVLSLFAKVILEIFKCLVGYELVVGMSWYWVRRGRGMGMT